MFPQVRHERPEPEEIGVLEPEILRGILVARFLERAQHGRLESIGDDERGDGEHQPPHRTRPRGAAKVAQRRHAMVLRASDRQIR
jgi:hypothetical protein